MGYISSQAFFFISVPDSENFNPSISTLTVFLSKIAGSQNNERNLGTKATRASILESLYDRGYVREKSVEATPLGISLIETLEKNSPIIADEKLTRDFEEDMENISQAKSGFQEKEEKVISKAMETIKKISVEFKEHENEIGRSLLKANASFVEQLKEQNKLCPCPVCSIGFLAITYSKKTRRFFIACNNFPKCRNTYSLPPNSLIKKSGKNCEKCHFPLLISIRKGKRPWIFCFNKNCETNRERLEEYKKKKESSGEFSSFRKENEMKGENVVGEENIKNENIKEETKE